MNRRCLKFVGIAAIVLQSQGAFASEIRPNYLILGVIASSKDRSGVALIKNVESNATFAAREGEKLHESIFLKSVTRKTVLLLINNKVYELKVGEFTDSIDTAGHGHGLMATMQGGTEGHIERSGNTVRITNRYKDFLVKDNLPRVLLSAASEPYFKDGRLAGFTLWEIDGDSIFKEIGLTNGDTIVAINENKITDAASTVNLLKSLKNESGASLKYLRNGTEHTIKVQID